jgi:hypothetical protein
LKSEIAVKILGAQMEENVEYVWDWRYKFGNHQGLFMDMGGVSRGGANRIPRTRPFGTPTFKDSTDGQNHQGRMRSTY